MLPISLITRHLNRLSSLKCKPHRHIFSRVPSLRPNRSQILHSQIFRQSYTTTVMPPSTSVAEFQALLAQVHKNNGRVMALCGAGLSAASGLGTFRGAGGMWRKYNAVDLATPEAFEEDPGLVWLFYSYRRHKALQAQPNPAHYALAELARKMDGFMCLSQNVDGLSLRANHPPDQLKLLHGSLFDITCSKSCDYIQKNNYDDPFHPLLAIADDEDESTKLAKASTTKKKPLEVGSQAVTIDPSLLPPCPSCKKSLLRPGVVWFGESLPKETISEIDAWIAAKSKIDIMLVIGTTAQVYPAAGYVNVARGKGARIVVVNMESSDKALGAAGGLRERDFLFQGDAGRVVPEILAGVIGEVAVDGVKK